MIVWAGYVAANWPPESKLIWSGVEVGLRVQSGGAGFQKCAVATERNPCAAAMINYEHGPDKSRFSWDPLTTLVAVRVSYRHPTREAHCALFISSHAFAGSISEFTPRTKSRERRARCCGLQGAAAASTAECTDCAGANHIDPSNGSNRWVPGPRTNQT